MWVKHVLLAAKNRLNRYPEFKLQLQRIIALAPPLEARLRGLSPTAPPTDVRKKMSLSELCPRGLELHDQLRLAINRCRKEGR